MKFDVYNRLTDKVQFTAEIDCDDSTPRSVKIGLAVRWGIKNSVNLVGVDLVGANLGYANLGYANLVGVDLRGADLVGADLRDAILRYANLVGANLVGADLRGADLGYANLWYANLVGADLRGADLVGADLRDAILGYANLVSADLRDAEGADLAIAKTRILPEGDLIAWKACRNGVIVKLRIPEDARRSHAFGRKCRAEFADVLDVFGADEGIGKQNAKTVYRPGERVHCHEWCEDWQQECAGGIHFFITREEAENWA